MADNPTNDNATGQGGEVGKTKSSDVNSTPKQPTPGTQPARLLAVLLTGRTITPLEAWTELSIMRVADTVFKLRGMGWQIDTIDTDDVNQFGEPTSYASYRLGGD